MSITTIFLLLGGLGLFLFGMKLMSDGLEQVAGARMRSILEFFTKNRFIGMLVGILFTAIVQSSSATTVMVVSFVNSGLMNLFQAAGVILGANIGTTVTGQLIAFNLSDIAPLFVIVGVVMFMFSGKQNVKKIGGVLLGFGILFMGLSTMSDAMSSLKESPQILGILQSLTNPLAAILVGFVVTAVLQSSSATVGIVILMANQGMLKFVICPFLILGCNMGSCVSALLASLGGKKDAKRAAWIHFLFNIIGTVMFTIICVTFPLTDFIENLLPGQAPAQIATMHMLFNITTTLVLLPLGESLGKLATVLLPDREVSQKQEAAMHLAYLTPIHAAGKEGGLGGSAIAIDQLRNELGRMLSMARENVDDGFRAVLDRDVRRLRRVGEREEYIDFLNREISRYVSQVVAMETNEESSAAVSSFFTVAGNVERIGDHANNLAGYTQMLADRDIAFSDAARGEIVSMREVSLQAILALLSRRAGTPQWLAEVAQLEQRIDDMTLRFRQSQLERMRTGDCDEEACILYAELLTDFERIGDHALNIAEELTCTRMTQA